VCCIAANRRRTWARVFFFPPFSISFSSVFFDFSFLFLLRQLFSISCIFIFSPSFLWLVTSAGIYTYTYAAERNESCVACSQIPKDLFFHENARLSEVMEHLSTTYQMKSPGVTTTDKQGRNRTLYLPNVSSIEERTRPNLKKTLKGTTNSRPDADDAVLVEVVVAPAASCLAPGGGPHPPLFYYPLWTSPASSSPASSSSSSSFTWCILYL
jgi:hypothetical protein